MWKWLRESACCSLSRRGPALPQLCPSGCSPQGQRVKQVKGVFTFSRFCFFLIFTSESHDQAGKPRWRLLRLFLKLVFEEVVCDLLGSRPWVA